MSIVLDEAIILAAGIQGIASRKNDDKSILNLLFEKISLVFQNDVIGVLKDTYLAAGSMKNAEDHLLFVEAIVEYKPKNNFLKNESLTTQDFYEPEEYENLELAKYQQFLSLICADNPTAKIRDLRLYNTQDRLSTEAMYQLLTHSLRITFANPSDKHILLVCKKSLCKQILIYGGTSYHLYHIFTNLTPTSKLKYVEFNIYDPEDDGDQLKTEITQGHPDASLKRLGIINFDRLSINVSLLILDKAINFCENIRIQTSSSDQVCHILTNLKPTSKLKGLILQYCDDSECIGFDDYFYDDDDYDDYELENMRIQNQPNAALKLLYINECGYRSFSAPLLLLDIAINLCDKIKITCDSSYQLFYVLTNLLPTSELKYVSFHFDEDLTDGEHNEIDQLKNMSTQIHQGATLKRLEITHLKKLSLKESQFFCDKAINLCEEIKITRGSSYQLCYILTNVTPTSKLKYVSFHIVDHLTDGDQLENISTQIHQGATLKRLKIIHLEDLPLKESQLFYDKAINSCEEIEIEYGTSYQLCYILRNLTPTSKLKYVSFHIVDHLTDGDQLENISTQIHQGATLKRLKIICLKDLPLKESQLFYDKAINLCDEIGVRGSTYQLCYILTNLTPTSKLKYVSFDIDDHLTDDADQLENMSTQIHPGATLKRLKITNFYRLSLKKSQLICDKAINLCEEIEIQSGTVYNLCYILTNLTPTSKLKRVYLTFDLKFTSF